MFLSVSSSFAASRKFITKTEIHCFGRELLESKKKKKKISSPILPRQKKSVFPAAAAVSDFGSKSTCFPFVLACFRSFPESPCRWSAAAEKVPFSCRTDPSSTRFRVRLQNRPFQRSAELKTAPERTPVKLYRGTESQFFLPGHVLTANFAGP